MATRGGQHGSVPAGTRCTLVLVRHGYSEWNAEKRFTGWADVQHAPGPEQISDEYGSKVLRMCTARELRFLPRQCKV